MRLREGMTVFDALILNGTVIDGTGRPRYAADVGMTGGEVREIGLLAGAAARERIDATGCVVCPGFIDMHTHSDVTPLDDPGGESKVHQGVTTEVIGHCGFSPFPAGTRGPAALKAALGSFLPSRAEWSWKDLAGWADRIEAGGVSLNLVPLVGHASLRIAVGVTENRVPSDAEMDTMRRLAREAADQGAFGISTGLTLPPSSYAATAEVVELASIFAAYEGAFYDTHSRCWANCHVKAMEEAVEIGRRARVPVQYSHMAIIDKREYGHGERMLGVFERARRDGVDVTYDVYPYTAAQTNLSQLIPEWVQEGGVEAMLRRLRDPADRSRARQEAAQGWFGGLPWDWDSIVLSHVRSEGNRCLLGRSLAQVARERTAEPIDVLLSLIDEEDNYVTAVMHNRVEPDVRYFLSHPLGMFGSDGRAVSPGGLYGGSRIHPRFYGTYPRILGRYVREEGIMSLETAIRKMTGFPAERLRLRSRGRIGVGMAADLVVFDPKAVIDRATFDDPHQFPDGIHYVFVNGKAVLAGGRHTGARPGKVLRRGD